MSPEELEDIREENRYRLELLRAEKLKEREEIRKRNLKYRNKHYAERILIDGKLVHPNAPHGTLGGYNYWGCKCEKCSECETEHKAAQYLARKEKKCSNQNGK